jgi:hypothetical protein
MILTELRDAAKLTAGRVLGGFTRHALAFKPFRERTQMFVDFVVQLDIRITSRKLPAEPRSENAQSPHASPARR